MTHTKSDAENERRHGAFKYIRSAIYTREDIRGKNGSYRTLERCMDRDGGSVAVCVATVRREERSLASCDHQCVYITFPLVFQVLTCISR